MTTKSTNKEFNPDNIIRMLEKDVQPGQVWLAAKNDDAEYVLTGKVSDDGRTVLVVPMSRDPELQTLGSLVVKDTPFGYGMVVWPKPCFEIPVRLLSIPFGNISDEAYKDIVNGTSNPDDGVFEADDAPDEDSNAYERYFEMLKLFTSWHKMRLQLPTPSEKSLTDYSEKDITLFFKTLVELGHDQQEAAAIVHGDMAVEESEQKILIGAGVPEDFVRQGVVLPAELLAEVEQPFWRTDAQKLEAQGYDDGRLQLAIEAKASDFALAARKAGSGRERWRKILRDVTSQNPGDAR